MRAFSILVALNVAAVVVWKTQVHVSHTIIDHYSDIAGRFSRMFRFSSTRMCISSMASDASGVN